MHGRSGFEIDGRPLRKGDYLEIREETGKVPTALRNGRRLKPGQRVTLNGMVRHIESPPPLREEDYAQPWDDDGPVEELERAQRLYDATPRWRWLRRLMLLNQIDTHLSAVQAEEMKRIEREARAEIERMTKRG